MFAEFLVQAAHNRIRFRQLKKELFPYHLI